MDKVLQEVVALLLLVCPGTAGSATADDGPSGLKEEAASWVARQYDRALDRLLPVRTRGQLPESVAWLLEARAVAVTEREWFLRFEMRDDGSTKIECAEVAGERLALQLQALHKADPTASIEALADRAVVRRRLVSEAECPVVRRVVEDLRALKVPLQLPDVLEMDGTAYRVVVRARYGDSMDIEVSGADQRYPLVRWVREAWAAIRACNDAAPGPAALSTGGDCRAAGVDKRQ